MKKFLFLLLAVVLAPIAAHATIAELATGLAVLPSSYIPCSTYANFPSVANASGQIHCASDVGQSGTNLFISDGAAWKPANGCVTIAGGGLGWSNTGLAVNTEKSLVSQALPPMRANDYLKIYTLWTRAGTGGDSLSLSIRLGTAGCTPQASCTNGSQVFGRSNTVTAAPTQSLMTIVLNRGATNSQVMFNNGSSSIFGETTAAPTTTAIETNATPFINLDCNTVTASTDTCRLEAYFIELCAP